jgi:hypothetical protein
LPDLVEGGCQHHLYARKTASISLLLCHQNYR